MRRLYAITGTPGTGKKTASPLVADMMKTEFFGLNELAEKWGLVGTKDEVDTSALKKRISSELKSRSLVFGHLVPFSLERDDVAGVAVLRCDPAVLKDRLEARGYDPVKVRSNVEAELIGTVSHDAHQVFGDLVFEVDSSRRTPNVVASEISRGFAGERKTVVIDWTFDYGSSAKLTALLS